MADAFTPRFVDLVRNYSTTVGTGDFALGPAVNGNAGFTAALQVGDNFYYSAIGVDKPAEREVGRGTLLANGIIRRDPISGTKTSFTGGTKAIALIAAAEWFGTAQALLSTAGAAGGALLSAASPAAARSVLELASASLAETDSDDTLAANSDARVPTQKAVRAFAARFPLTIADRAGLSGASTAAGAAYLREKGRDGLFVWDSTDLSAMVAADPNQGLHVAPATNPSGASGAWVRRFTGRAISTWWGVIAGGAAAANGAAMAAALTTLKKLAVLGYGYNNQGGSVGLHTPAGVYAMDRPIQPAHAVAITGDYTGNISGGGTVFVFSNATSGFKIDGWDGSSHRGNGSSVDGVQLKGAFAGADGSAHGMEVNAHFTARNFAIQDFSGDGIYAWGSVGTVQGNANDCLFENGSISGCRHGTYTDSADANSITFIHVSCSSNRRSGHFDSSFLGCRYYGGDISTNGLTQGFPTRCSQSGNMYAVKLGQEAWCAANAPTGTTASNQGWLYMRAGAPGTLCPAWASGLTWYHSAPFCNDDVNQASRFDGLYVEQDGNPAICAGSALVTGGAIAVPVVSAMTGLPYGGWVRGNDTTTRFGRNLQIDNAVSGYGALHFLGPQPGSPNATGEGELQLHNMNSSSTLSFYSGGLFKGRVWNAAGSNYYDSSAHVFRSSSSSPWATLDANGLAVKVGSIGYATGAGGAAAQATSKSTTVALNKACGQITMNAAALAANAGVAFTVTNSMVAATDTVGLVLASGNATPGSYSYQVDKVSAGSFVIWVKNISGASLGEALLFNFAVKKAVAA